MDVPLLVSDINKMEKSSPSMDKTCRILLLTIYIQFAMPDSAKCAVELEIYVD